MVLEVEKLLLYSSKNDVVKGKPADVITFDYISDCLEASPKELRDSSAVGYTQRPTPTIKKKNAFRLLNGYDKHGCHSYYFCTETAEESIGEE